MKCRTTLSWALSGIFSLAIGCSHSPPPSSLTGNLTLAELEQVIADPYYDELNAVAKATILRARGVVHTFLGERSEAERDLREAFRLFDRVRCAAGMVRTTASQYGHSSSSSTACKRAGLMCFRLTVRIASRLKTSNCLKALPMLR